MDCELVGRFATLFLSHYNLVEMGNLPELLCHRLSLSKYQFEAVKEFFVSKSVLFVKLDKVGGFDNFHTEVLEQLLQILRFDEPLVNISDFSCTALTSDCLLQIESILQSVAAKGLVKVYTLEPHGKVVVAIHVVSIILDAKFSNFLDD